METLRKHALNIAAFLWGVAEATLFFFVPDVILSYIGVRQGPQAAAKASLIAAAGAAVGGILMYLWSQSDPFAAAGAAVGGILMYLWSQSDPFAARQAVEAVPAISAEMINRAHDAMRGDWFGATFFGPLTSTPYKVYAILAPQNGVPLWSFALASIIARLPRFLGVSIGVALIAAYLRRQKLPERTILAILAGAWIAFYVLFFSLMPG